jgi:hypothetical protein
MHRVRALLPLAISLLEACSADDATSSIAARAIDATPHPSVYAAGAYIAVGLASPGEFTDVNAKGLMVGDITLPAALYRSAFSYQLGGSVNLLSNGSGLWSTASAVNGSGAIAGAVFDNSVDYHPAVWSSTTSTPMALPHLGTAADINDAGLVVGTILRNGVQYAFLWDPAGGGKPTMLPPLPGGTASYAIAINSRNVILGSSSSSTGWSSVLWRSSGGVWVPRPIVGINALALAEGNVVVGQTANEASWGKPDYAGSFGVGVYSHATGVAPDASVAIGRSSYPVTGPAVQNAWVADRRGSLTFLPLANSLWQATYGAAVNACGLAVGSYLDFTGARRPAYWNPGC